MCCYRFLIIYTVFWTVGTNHISHPHTDVKGNMWFYVDFCVCVQLPRGSLRPEYITIP